MTFARLSICALLVFAAGCQRDEPLGDGAADPLAVIVDGWHRRDADRARDAARNPIETLRFMGLSRAMKVVELWPGGGWYADIVAPYARATGGVYVAAHTDPDGPVEYRRQWATDLEARLDARPKLYGAVEHRVLAPPETTELTEPGTADLVLCFRNLHNWYDEGGLEEALAGVHRALKPGGLFGVVAHRAAEGADPQQTGPKGYLPQAFVIDVVTRAGFEFVASAELNANPRDTKDYPKGVWMLPPSLRWVNDPQMRTRHIAIGESDRMTLRFRKGSLRNKSVK